MRKRRSDVILRAKESGVSGKNNNFSAIVLSLHHDRSLSLSLSFSLSVITHHISLILHVWRHDYMYRCTHVRMYACKCMHVSDATVNKPILTISQAGGSTDRGVWLDMAQYKAMYRNKYTNKLVLHQSKCGYIFTVAIKFKWAAVSLMLMSTHPASLKFERRPLAPLSHIY